MKKKQKNLKMSEANILHLRCLTTQDFPFLISDVSNVVRKTCRMLDPLQASKSFVCCTICVVRGVLVSFRPESNSGFPTSYDSAGEN